MIYNVGDTNLMGPHRGITIGNELLLVVHLNESRRIHPRTHATHTQTVLFFDSNKGPHCWNRDGFIEKSHFYVAAVSLRI